MMNVSDICNWCGQWVNPGATCVCRSAPSACSEARSLEQQIADLKQEIDDDEALRGTQEWELVADRYEENQRRLEELESYLPEPQNAKISERDPKTL